MDFYTNDSAHRAVFRKALTPEEKTTHRRWAWAVFAVYGTVIILGGIAIMANYSSSTSSSLVAQVSQQKVP